MEEGGVSENEQNSWRRLAAAAHDAANSTALAAAGLAAVADGGRRGAEALGRLRRAALEDDE